MVRVRKILSGVVLITAALHAGAQSFPAKPVRVLVPFPPGGPTDITARLYADKLGARLGQSFIVENKPGPNGIAVYNAVLAAPADGYTLAFTAIGGQVIQPVINAYLKQRQEPDVNAAFVPIGLLAESPLVLVVSPRLPVNTAAELIAYVKAHPGKLNFGSDGVGSTTHLATELFHDAVGIRATDAVHVPYKGSVDVMNAMMQGDVQYSFSGILAALSLHRAGKVRIIAIGGASGVAALPKVPTVAEAANLPGFDVASWFALYALKDVAPERLALLSAEIQDIARMSDVIERFASLGLQARPIKAQELQQKVAADIRKWSNLLNRIQIKLN
jgi:tripartite-type tricarboxylate transporter receptor subunit TctC